MKILSTFSDGRHSYMTIYLNLLGEDASWWLNGVEDIFGTSMTAATVSVLQSELQSCQELLEMEPDNKCEWCFV